MGPNGIDIAQVGLCTNCNCKELPYVEVDSVSTDAVLVCCPEYNGEVKLWSQTGGTGATAYYTDQFQINKYDPGATGYISNGKDVTQLLSGTPSYFGACTPTLCNDRSETFYINVVNALPADPVNITVNGLLSLNGTDTFYNGTFNSSGTSFNFEYEAYYPVRSYFGAEITSSSVNPGAYTYNMYWNGELIETNTVDEGYTTPTGIYGPLEPGDVFSIDIAWNVA
jgi:hypothetical protein